MIIYFTAELISPYMSKMAEAFEKIRYRNKTETSDLSSRLAEVQKKIYNWRKSPL